MAGAEMKACVFPALGSCAVRPGRIAGPVIKKVALRRRALKPSLCVQKPTSTLGLLWAAKRHSFALRLLSRHGWLASASNQTPWTYCSISSGILACLSVMAVCLLRLKPPENWFHIGPYSRSVIDFLPGLRPHRQKGSICLRKPHQSHEVLPMARKKKSRRESTLRGVFWTRWWNRTLIHGLVIWSSWWIPKSTTSTLLRLFM
jgi:hypothetical protein